MSAERRVAPTYDELPERTEVVVVGGGIAGCATLHHLAERGVRAVLVERNELSGGATSAAVGILSPPLRQPFNETVHARGETVARAIWEFALRSVRAFGDTLEELGVAEATDLDRSGGWILADAATQHEVRSSCDALAHAGFPVRWFGGEEAARISHGRGFTGGYHLEGGGAVSPGPAARALAENARANGALIVEGVGVNEVEVVDDGLTCTTSAGPVRCEMVVYATHVDSRRFSALLGDEIVPIRGQAAALGAPPELRVDGAFATHWKLNVWRFTAAGDLLVSGWRHDAWDRSYWKMQPEVDARLQNDIVEWFRSAFTGWGELEVRRRWSGIFGWTADYLPLVGPLPGTTREWVISGFSGGGLPFAFECGRGVAAAIAGADPVEGMELFAPRRFL